MNLVAHKGTITQTPLCANFVPRISVDHWVRGVWAYYYLGFRPRRPLALHWLGVSLSQSWFSDQLVFTLDLQKIILGTHTSFRISCRWKGIHNHSTIVRMWGTLACGVPGTVRHAKNLDLIIPQSVAKWTCNVYLQCKRILQGTHGSFDVVLCSQSLLAQSTWCVRL